MYGQGSAGAGGTGYSSLEPEPEPEPRAASPSGVSASPGSGAGQETPADFARTLHNVPAAEARASSAWEGEVLLRADVRTGLMLKDAKWDKRWLIAYPEHALDTAAGPTQCILVYKGQNARTPLRVVPACTDAVEAHRTFDSGARPPRFQFEVDSRGDDAWQLTFAVEAAEAAEGWSQYWSWASDGFAGTGRVGSAEPARMEGALGMRSLKARNFEQRWAVVRGSLLQFWKDEAAARQAGALLAGRGVGVGGGKGAARALEATVHLEHAVVSPSPSGSASEFEIVCGGKEWRLQAESEAAAEEWMNVCSRAAGGAQEEEEGGGLVTVRAERGQAQLGISFAQCFSQGMEYFSVQRIRGPNTVGAAAEPALKTGMVLHSINGVGAAALFAAEGAMASLQEHAKQRPLTLTFVRSPQQLDYEAVSPVPTVAVVESTRGERRLVSDTSGRDAGMGLRPASSYWYDSGLETTGLPATAAAFPPTSRGVVGPRAHFRNGGDASDSVGPSPISAARAQYGTWWDSMSQSEKAAAVGRTESEQRLVAMGVLNGRAVQASSETASHGVLHTHNERRMVSNGRLTLSPRSEPATSPRKPVRYRVVKTAVIRCGFELNSDEVGRLERGEVINVLERRETIADGMRTVRLRFDRGWTSTSARSGNMLLVPDDSSIRTLPYQPMSPPAPLDEGHPHEYEQGATDAAEFKQGAEDATEFMDGVRDARRFASPARSPQRASLSPRRHRLSDIASTIGVSHHGAREPLVRMARAGHESVVWSLQQAVSSGDSAQMSAVHAQCSDYCARNAHQSAELAAAWEALSAARRSRAAAAMGSSRTLSRRLAARAGTSGAADDDGTTRIRGCVDVGTKYMRRQESQGEAGAREYEF